MRQTLAISSKMRLRNFIIPRAGFVLVARHGEHGEHSMRKTKETIIDTRSSADLLLEKALTLANSQHRRPVRLNAARESQPLLKRPLEVHITGTSGEGSLAGFDVSEKDVLSNLRWFRSQPVEIGDFNWPLRMSISSADGEKVVGIVRPDGVTVERRHFPCE